MIRWTGAARPPSTARSSVDRAMVAGIGPKDYVSRSTEVIDDLDNIMSAIASVEHEIRVIGNW